MATKRGWSATPAGTLLIPALLLAAFAQAPAPARHAAAPVPGSAAPAGEERKRIESLMRRAVEAARKEAETARSAPGLDPDDRRDAQWQFARILQYADGCAAAVPFVRDRPEILGASVKMLVSGALNEGDRRCAIALVPFVLERWQDPYFVPQGRIGLRFYAGAVLDSAGKAEGKAVMRESEAQMKALADSSFLWNARWYALEAYAGTPGLGNYLEYLADRMAAERLSPLDSKRNGIFAIFAHHDRCDLVERVTKAGPASCDEPRTDARRIYGPQSPEQIEGDRTLGSWMGIEEPTLDEQGLKAALTPPAPWGRVGKLLLFVSYCRWVLDGRRRPGQA